MSSQPKITSKNLSYSNDLPPFLARLRGQQDQQRNSDSPDPILAARRRAARPRSASEEAEDAPLVVDEAGNTIAFPGADGDVSVETGDGDKEGKEGRNADDEGGKEREKEREKVAGIGASKKRKVGRVVGGDEDEESATTASRARIEKESLTKSGDKKETKHSTDHNSKETKSSSKQGKKKAKKIKLSFGDDGD
ncbi:hypothetical protein F4806DRAFT_499629 [Annulohypoxylon nitens]|nr:hypothetical protein F4806DRAFT_499629 [Annulohypoxylon nitens]